VKSVCYPSSANSGVHEDALQYRQGMSHPLRHHYHNKGFIMREQLRGRNLAHVGCLVGLIIGLSGGIALAWALVLHNVAALAALGVWLALTVVLGAVGYAVGDATTGRKDALPHE
jgi:hypothetical protein